MGCEAFFSIIDSLFLFFSTGFWRRYTLVDSVDLLFFSSFCSTKGTNERARGER